MRRLSLAPILALLLLPSSVMGQIHRGSVRGTVTDINGAVIVGAQIKLINRENAQVRTATTDDEGNYAISSLSRASYRLEITAGGFAMMPREFYLGVNLESRVDARAPGAGYFGSVWDRCSDG